MCEKDKNTLDLMIGSLRESALNCLFVADGSSTDKKSIIHLLTNIKEKEKSNDTIDVFGKRDSAVIRIYGLHYTDHMTFSDELVKDRLECIKNIYYNWCYFRGINPNPKEGWFKSLKFSNYLKTINYDKMNYVIMLVK